MMSFAAILLLTAQVMLPHRGGSGNFNAGNNNTNSLSFVTGEHPVLVGNKVYASLWNFYATNGPSGMAIIDAFAGTTLNTIAVTNNYTDSAPYRDAAGKWQLYAYDGTLYRLNEGGLNVEAALTGLKVGVDWESPASPDNGTSIIVPLASGGLQAVNCANYATKTWTNTAPVYDTSAGGIITPSILVANGATWAIDHRSTLWKLNSATGATIATNQTTVGTFYSYSAPIFDSDHGNIIWCDTSHYYALDPNAMTNKWTYTLESPFHPWRPPCYANNTVYLVEDWAAASPHRIVVTALNATTGARVWRNNYCMENILHTGAPMIDANYYYAATFDANATNLHVLMAINGTTGRQAAITTLAQNVSSGTAQVWRGKFFQPLWTNGMEVIKYRSAGGDADRPWHSDANYTANVAGNSLGSLLYAATNSYNLTSGLAAYWRLDEASGNRVDVVGSLALTNHSGTQVAGLITNAISFASGSSAYAQGGDYAATRLNTAGWTITFWVKFSSVANTCCLVRKGSEVATDWTFNWVSAGGGGPFLRLVTKQASGNIQTDESVFSPGFTTGVWYFICAWQDTGTQKQYLQCQMRTPTTTADTSTISDGGASIILGSAGGSSNFANAAIDELGIWSRTLSIDERVGLFNVFNGLAPE